MRTALIGAPTSLGAFAPGQEQAPRALREAGLRADPTSATSRCAAGGPTASTGAPRTPTAWRRRRARWPSGSRRRSAPARRPSCSAATARSAIGTVAGAQAAGERLGLVYFDLHPDLNTPETVDTGTLDWMGVAHMLGLAGTCPSWPGSRGSPPRTCCCSPARTTRRAPASARRSSANGIESIMVEEVAADPRAAAKRASQRFERYLVHFDVDVVDFVDLPLSENTGHNIGLPFDAACAALEVLVAGAGFAGLTVTEHNPAHGAEDGSTTAALAAALQRVLSCAASRPSGAAPVLDRGGGGDAVAGAGERDAAAQRPLGERVGEALLDRRAGAGRQQRRVAAGADARDLRVELLRRARRRRAGSRSRGRARAGPRRRGRARARR